MKKEIPLYILKYLYENAGPDKPASQGKIAEEIERIWGIEIDRKTVNRHMGAMKDENLGLEFEKNAGGYWLSHRFKDQELRLLSDAIMSSKYISAEESKEIIEKLSSLASANYVDSFSNILIMDDSRKNMSSLLFSKLDCIDRAIKEEKEISFTYTSWYRDEVIRAERSGEQVKTPVCIIYMDQRYYMVTGYTDDEYRLHTEYYAVDKMDSPSVADREGKNGCVRVTDIDLDNIKDVASRKLPADIEKKNIKVMATDIIIHSLETNFGRDVIKKEINDGGRYMYTVALKATEPEFMEFLKENMNELKLIAPGEMVEKFKADVLRALKEYE